MIESKVGEGLTIPVPFIISTSGSPKFTPVKLKMLYPIIKLEALSLTQ